MSETGCILQFGGGNFLRAFVDLFLQELNDSGEPGGEVTVVQSTTSRRAEQINAQKGRYHVILRGIREGEKVDEVHPVSSIRRALVAAHEWDDLRAIAASDSLELIVSNTTEAGLELEEGDSMTGSSPRTSPRTCPVSFPAKLALLLHERYVASGLRISVLPCELVDGNGARLRELVLEQARLWGMEDAYVNWLSSEVVWLTTLVDRIVSGRPAAHPLLEQDPLLTVAEPYAFWAIEDGGEHHRLYDHPAIQRVPDVTPFALRKVRILNGAHTALVAKALPMGIETVREAVAHPDVRPWLERLLEEEIVPVVTDRVADAEGFAATILERFENPFLDHRLSDIALHHETKVAHRLRPTYQEYVQRFGEAPTLLAELVRSGG